jgi:hypothetical protein
MAHAASAYGSHYFRLQSSDNSEMRWHDLLMPSMQICLLCTARAASSYHQRRYTNRSQPNGHVFATVHRNLKQTGEIMPPVDTVAAADAMCRIKRKHYMVCTSYQATITRLVSKGTDPSQTGPYTACGEVV